MLLRRHFAVSCVIALASLRCGDNEASNKVSPTVGEQRQALTSLEKLAINKSSNIMAEDVLGLKNDVMSVGTPASSLLEVKGIWAPPYIASDFSLTGAINGSPRLSSDFTWYPIEMKRTANVGSVAVQSRLVLVSAPKAALLLLDFSNSGASAAALDLSFAVSSTLDARTTDADYGFQAASSTTPTATPVLLNGGHTITLSQGSNTLALCSNALTWTTGRTGTGTVSVPGNGQASVALSIAIGAGEAASNCTSTLLDPNAVASSARDEYVSQLDALYTHIPTLQTNSPQLQHFYERSAMHPLLNRWSSAFFLHPYYSTGGMRGGTLSSYLWNFGEPWEVLPLVDPAAVKSHVKAFSASANLLASHYAFRPMAGTAFGAWYPVNQEKFIGLVYNYVKLTGDAAFLNESDGTDTILARVLTNATLLEGSPASGMIDYGPEKDHLELAQASSYNHVMPDLNGRRYESYRRASELASLAGDSASASALSSKANALGATLKQALWNPSARWFDYLSGTARGTRYTVQLFYLLGSGVLDTEEELGLLNHLNESEFLSPYGLHSLSKQDPVYDSGDVDNGGPGSCTAFPLQIAERLYRLGAYQKAEAILSRVLWWGEHVPYWGDSFLAASMDYRRGTPLEATLDAITGVQLVVFGMFGIDVTLAGAITVSPHPPAFASQIALHGVKLRGLEFDVEVANGTFTVTKNGLSLTQPLGSSINVASAGLSVGARSSAYVAATVASAQTSVPGFPSGSEIYAIDGEYLYWHSGASLRRGKIVGGTLAIDPTFAFDGVSASDHFFAANGNVVYWQFGNQVRRGTVGSGTLSIDASFSNNGFSSADHLFAASGDVVYWQSGAQVRRAEVSSQQISIDGSFSTNDFQATDAVYAAAGNTVYWRSGGQLRCGLVTAGHVQNEPTCNIDDFEVGGTPFAMVGSRVYWFNGGNVKSRWMSMDKVVLNEMYKAVDTTSSLVAVSGNVVYWQSGSQIRRGTVSNGSLTVDTGFQTSEFNAADRLFAASGNDLYWQLPTGGLRSGTLTGGHVVVNNALNCDDFASGDRLFAATGNTVYWQFANQLRSGTISGGHVSVDPVFKSNDFSSADRLFAVSGGKVYWQSGNQLRRASIISQHPSIDQAFSSNAFSPNERLFAASGENVFWQTR